MLLKLSEDNYYDTPLLRCVEATLNILLLEPSFFASFHSLDDGDIGPILHTKQEHGTYTVSELQQWIDAGKPV